MQFDWKSVGVAALLGLGLAGCGGSSAQTKTQDSGTPPGGKDPVASCASSAAQTAAPGFSPSAEMRTQKAQSLLAGSFNVVQTIPAKCTEGADQSSAVVLFFDGVIDPSTVSPQTLSLMNNAEPVPTSVTFSASAAGNSILALTPTAPLAAGAKVTVGWDGLMSAAGAAVTPADASFGVTTETASLDAAAFSPSGTELPPGVTCSGDCAVRDGAFGDAPELSKTHSVYFSTGGSVRAGTANDGTTSSLTMKGMTNNGGTLTFNYRFISAEMPDFFGTIFDDVFMVVVAGPDGKRVETVTTVNTLWAALPLEDFTDGIFDETGSVNATHIAGQPGQHSMMTGVLSGSVSTAGLGSPITVIFTASDVGDKILDTVIQLNDIAIQ